MPGAAGRRAPISVVKTAAKFRSDITLIRDDLEVNGKSIMGVMMLAAGMGASVELETDGDDEQAAQDQITALVNDKFGEGQ